MTVLILAVGLLGLAGLQAVSMRNNHSAYLRSQAVQLAYDMADRVRANSLANRDLSLFDNPEGAEKAECLTATGCNEQDMAVNDVWEWKNQVANTLPGGEAVICRDITPDDGVSADENECEVGTSNTLTVKIWWNDDRTSDTPQRFVMSFRP